MLNFSDITTYKKLKREEEKIQLLNILNQSIHHEMIGPLKANIEFAESLARSLKRNSVDAAMAQTIAISSK